jgi:hypothetical protein
MKPDLNTIGVRAEFPVQRMSTRFLLLTSFTIQECEITTEAASFGNG